MVIGTAKALLKHMFLTCCITTKLTKCLDTGNRTFFFRAVFSSSCPWHIVHLFPVAPRADPSFRCSSGCGTGQSNTRAIFCLILEARKTYFHISMVGLTNSIRSWYVYSKDFSLIGSLPWFRGKIVEEFTRAVSSIYANITNVHFLDFVFVVWSPMRWSKLSVPHSMKSYSLCNPNLWQLSSFVAPKLAQELTTWGHFFFPLMTSQHTRTTIKVHIFANKSHWTMVPVALHSLFQYEFPFRWSAWSQEK